MPTSATGSVIADGGEADGFDAWYYTFTRRRRKQFTVRTRILPTPLATASNSAFNASSGANEPVSESRQLPDTQSKEAPF